MRGIDSRGLSLGNRCSREFDKAVVRLFYSGLYPAVYVHTCTVGKAVSIRDAPDAAGGRLALDS